MENTEGHIYYRSKIKICGGSVSLCLSVCHEPSSPASARRAIRPWEWMKYTSLQLVAASTFVSSTNFLQIFYFSTATPRSTIRVTHSPIWMHSLLRKSAIYWGTVVCARGTDTALTALESFLIAFIASLFYFLINLQRGFCGCFYVAKGIRAESEVEWPLPQL